MSYTEFENLFLVAAYAESQDRGEGRVRSGDVLKKYDLSYQPMWVHNCISDWGMRGWIRGKGVIGDENVQPIMFTGSGSLEAERRMGKGWEPELRQGNVAPSPPASSTVIPPAIKIVKTTAETHEIVARMHDVTAKVGMFGLSQEEESQAKAYLAASIAIADSPSPTWEIVKDVLNVIAAIAGIGGFIVAILALI